MKGGEFLLPSALAEAHQKSFEAVFACCQIEKAALGNKAGLVGAALWAKQQEPKSKE